MDRRQDKLAGRKKEGLRDQSECAACGIEMGWKIGILAFTRLLGQRSSNFFFLVLALALAQRLQLAQAEGPRLSPRVGPPAQGRSKHGSPRLALFQIWLGSVGQRHLRLQQQWPGHPRRGPGSVTSSCLRLVSGGGPCGSRGDRSSLRQ